MYTLVTSIEVEGKQFHIRENGDFRMILDCFSALQDEKLSEDYRVLACLLIFYNEFNDFNDLFDLDENVAIELMNHMFEFFNCGQPDSPGAKTETPLIDWDKDSTMICSAINKVAGTEIRALEYLHWWTFVGYYMAIGQSVMATVVGIRDKITRHKKLEKWEQEFKKQNPNYFVWKNSSVRDREAEDLVRILWNKGSD